MSSRKFLLVIALWVLLLSGCRPYQTLSQKEVSTPSFTSTSTLTQTPTIDPTSTNTPTSTCTFTPTITPTFTLTFTPTITFTATLTPTPIPMSQTSKYIIEKAISFGFVEDKTGCNQELNCRFYEHQEPFASIKIYNNGKIIYIVNEFDNGWTDYIKPENSNPPYKMMLEYYFNYADGFFGRSSAINFGSTGFAVMSDAIEYFGKYEMDTDYGYVVVGKPVKPGKIMMTFFPPE